jgi:hypothetical protein
VHGDPAGHVVPSTSQPFSGFWSQSVQFGLQLSMWHVPLWHDDTAK